MRTLKLTIDDPLCLTLASDARTSPVQYPNDIIWRVTFGSGSPPALGIESNLGLRARNLRLFFRFIRQENDLIDPLEFSTQPVVQQQLPGYFNVASSPFSGLDANIEFWVAASSVLAGRITLQNNSILPENIRLQLCGLLSPMENGEGFAPAQMGVNTVLCGRTSGLSPVLFVTGGPESGSGPYPNLSLDISLPSGDQRQLTWALALLPESEDSLQLAKLTTGRAWDAEITHLELLHASQTADVHTPVPDWNAAITLSQSLAFRLLMPSSPHLPNPSFVLAREPENGYSLREDGSDYSYLWNGQTVFDAWYLAGSLLPGAYILARGIVENFIAIADETGFIDYKPGLAGQRSRMLAQPMLASLVWRLNTYSPDPAWLKRIYDPLLKFVRLWLSPAHDQDGDGFPEWDHPLQTGLEQSPIYDTWREQSQGADIHQLECPALGAMLFRECQSLKEIGRILKKQKDVAWLEERADQLKRTVENTWDEKGNTYRYCDVSSNRFLNGTMINTFEIDGKYRLRRKFMPARRILVKVKSYRDHTQIVSLRLHGQTETGKVVEEISARDLHWTQGNGRASTKNLFVWLESIEIMGLGEQDTISVGTIDTMQEDISLLLPLWAGIPDMERAKQLIEGTIVPRYFKQYGLSTCPDGDIDRDFPDLSCAILPWNELIGEGLIRYGYRDLAAELFSRLMNTQVTIMKQENGFRAPLCAENNPVSAERNTLSGLSPLGLLWNILGLNRMQKNDIMLWNPCPLPGPITVQYLGTNILFQSKSSVVRFFNGENVTVTRPGKRRIHY